MKDTPPGGQLTSRSGGAWGPCSIAVLRGTLLITPISTFSGMVLPSGT